MKNVKKTWGNELWFENNDKYCGKLITVECGKWSSEGKYHYQPLLSYKERDHSKIG